MDIKKLAPFTLGLYILGCSEGADKQETSKEESAQCTAELVPAIAVKVFDDETGLPISCGASLMIGDGDFVETIIAGNTSDRNVCFDSMSLQGAFERPGFYSVVVSKLGYLDYVATDIEVTQTSCHVRTANIQAYLTKS